MTSRSTWWVVGPVVGLVEGVAHVIKRVAEERDERRVVKALIDWITHLLLLFLLDALKEFG